MIDMSSSSTPHFNNRPNGTIIDCIVLHADASKSENGTLAWFRDPVSKVSYHYLIARSGHIWQIVDDKKRAWHAGVSVFEGRPNCNDYSLGVSFSNDQAGEPFTPQALRAGVELCAKLCREHHIPVHRITTHAAVSPGRKHDPGPLFPLSDFLADVTEELERPL